MKKEIKKEYKRMLVEVSPTFHKLLFKLQADVLTEQSQHASMPEITNTMAEDRYIKNFHFKKKISKVKRETEELKIHRPPDVELEKSNLTIEVSPLFKNHITNILGVYLNGGYRFSAKKITKDICNDTNFKGFEVKTLDPTIYSKVKAANRRGMFVSHMDISPLFKKKLIECQAQYILIGQRLTYKELTHLMALDPYFENYKKKKRCKI